MALVKGTTLLCPERVRGETASGVAMPPNPIQKRGTLSGSMTLATREAFKSVEASWHNQETGTHEPVTGVRDLRSKDCGTPSQVKTKPAAPPPQSGMNWPAPTTN